MPPTNAKTALQNSNRRILVSGPKGSGKTTFSMSADRAAGPTIVQSAKVLCSGTWVINGDEEGFVGAMDAGLEPAYVTDVAQCSTWRAYQTVVAADLKDMVEKLKSKEVNRIIIDLGLPDKLINSHIDPTVQKDWRLVITEGGVLYRMFSGFPGVTVIGNYQLKAAASPGETEQAKAASEAKAIGGERSTFAANLQKGVYDIWSENASMIFTREVKREKANDGGVKLTYKTHTQSGPRFEGKSRFRSVIKPVEMDASLNNILQRAYGDAY